MRWRYVILFLVLLLLVACQSKNRSTDTYSTKFFTDSEKIAFLKQYVKCFSPAFAAEFHIEYYDNSTGWVPGPSDWDFKIAIRIAPSDTTKWVAEFQEVEKDEVDLSWITEIPLEASRWRTTSTPHYYRRAGATVELVVYKEEGILFKRIRTQ